MKYISSRDNAQFKRLRGLAEDARNRRAEAATLIDGEHLLEAALESDWPLSRLLLQEGMEDLPVVRSALAALGGRELSPEVLVLSPALFKALSPVATPTGILAEIPLRGPHRETASTDDVLVLAGVQDAGNLGTLLRTAAAAGCRQAWLDRQCAQAWSPKAMRAGMGAQFRLVIEEGCDLVRRLTDCGRQVLATSLADDSVSLYSLDLRVPCVWVFGSEGQGVPTDLLALAGRRVTIPMPGLIESLNVGAAAAVCLFEQVRQRI